MEQMKAVAVDVAKADQGLFKLWYKLLTETYWMKLRIVFGVVWVTFMVRLFFG